MLPSSTWKEPFNFSHGDHAEQKVRMDTAKKVREKLNVPVALLLMSKGDKKAYETMFRRFYPKVHRFVAMLLKNEDDADDVSQLIFLKVWNKREKFADL